MTFKVSEKLRRRMRSLGHVNWSEVARRAVEERLRLEEDLEKRPFDFQLLDKAIETQDAVRARSSGKWSLSKEISRWRTLRR